MNSDSENPYRAPAVIDPPRGPARRPQRYLPGPMIWLAATLSGLATFVIAYFGDAILGFSPLWHVESAFFFATASSSAVTVAVTWLLRRSSATLSNRPWHAALACWGLPFLMIALAGWVWIVFLAG